MKGYLALFMVVLMCLSVIPVVLSKNMTSDGPVMIEPVENGSLAVMHTDQNGQSSLSAQALSVYETAALMPPDTPAEALKAGILAVYTNFRYQCETAGTVTSTTLSFPEGYTDAFWKERWGEQYDANMTVYRAAWDAVKGQTVRYQGDTAMTLYHVMNGGVTEDGAVVLGESVPYLCSVASPADALSPTRLTTVTVPLSEAEPVLKTLCGKEQLPEAPTWFSAPQKTTAGTVTAITVCGAQQTGATVRDAFSLPSAAFDVCVQDGNVIFTVSGNGHFVGLSACGAATMAKDGMTYDAILKHYFQGVTVS